MCDLLVCDGEAGRAVQDEVAAVVECVFAALVELEWCFVGSDTPSAPIHEWDSD